MMNFTRDERNLMMLYSPGTRSGLCEALLQMKEQLSEEEAELCAWLILFSISCPVWMTRLLIG